MALQEDKAIVDAPVGESENNSLDDATPPNEASDIEVKNVNEKALLRKLDWQLLPAVGILYLLSFLDRSNGSSILVSRSM